MPDPPPKDLQCNALLNAADPKDPNPDRCQRSKHLIEAEGWWSVYCPKHRSLMIEMQTNNVRTANGHRAGWPVKQEGQQTAKWQPEAEPDDPDYPPIPAGRN